METLINLKNLRMKKGYTQLQMAELLEIQRPTYSRYESGERQPDHATLLKLAEIFNVSIDYILGRTDFSVEENYIICENISALINKIKSPVNPNNIMGIEMTFNSIAKYEYQFTHESLEKFASYFGVSKSFLCTKQKAPAVSSGIKIPVLGYVAAGIPIEAIENIIDYEEISSEQINPNFDYFGLKIKGDSMSPRIQDGDVVIVRKQSDVDSGDIAIVCVNGDSATCKQIKKHSEGISLIPFNTSHEVKFYSNQEIESLPISIIGKVVELRGKF